MSKEPTQKPAPVTVPATVTNPKHADIRPGLKILLTGFTATIDGGFTKQSGSVIARDAETRTLSFGFDEIDTNEIHWLGAVAELMSIEAVCDSASVDIRDGDGDRMKVSGRVKRLAELSAKDKPGPNCVQVSPTFELLPEAWEQLLGLQILDWDGWNDVGRDLSIPCTIGEFLSRAAKCTQNLRAFFNAIPTTTTSLSKDLKSVSENGRDCSDDLTRSVAATVAGHGGFETLEEYVKYLEGKNEAQRTHIEALQVRVADLMAHLSGQEAPKPAQIVAERPVSAPHPEKREKLPDTRVSTTHKFDVGGQKGYITAGIYPDGRPGEVFIVVQRQGSTLQGFADAWARSVSMLLQYGVPAAEIARMFAWHKFEPRGHTPNPQIAYANSIVDYIARWLGHTFVARYAPGADTTKEVEA